MALEDFACFRTVPGAVCFYPSDAVSCERALELAANHRGITFTRTSRPATTVIYKQDEVFEVGKGKVRWAWSYSYVLLSPLHTCQDLSWPSPVVRLMGYQLRLKSPVHSQNTFKLQFQLQTQFSEVSFSRDIPEMLLLLIAQHKGLSVHYISYLVISLPVAICDHTDTTIQVNSSIYAQTVVHTVSSGL